MHNFTKNGMINFYNGFLGCHGNRHVEKRKGSIFHLQWTLGKNTQSFKKIGDMSFSTYFGAYK